MTRRSLVLFAALGVIWGLPYLLIRVSVRDVTPAFLVFVRTAGGALLMAPFVIRRGALRSLWPHWRAVLAYTIVEVAVPWWLLSTAEKKVDSSLSGLLVTAVPIAGAVIARVTGTERVDARRLGGLGLGVAGVAALVGFDVNGPSTLAASSFLLIVTGYALGPWILAHRLSGLPGPAVIFASLVVCAVAYAPIAALQRPRGHVPVTGWLAIAGLTVVCTAVAFTLFFALIREVGPMRATVVTYLNPAVAVLLGVVVLGEPFGWVTGVGFLAVLGGSWLATRPVRSTGGLSGGTPVLAPGGTPAATPGAAPASASGGVMPPVVR